MLQISLTNNKLTKNDERDCMAVVQNRRYKTLSELVDQLTGEGSILKPTECEAVIVAALRTITKNLHQGYGFQSEFLTLAPSVSGVFVNRKDRFDRERHQVDLKLRLGAPIKEALAKVPVEIIPHTAPLPEIEEVFDHKSKTTNDLLSPGHTLDISGERLKVADVTSPEQGVFLVSETEEIKVPYIFRNNPKSLQVELPDKLKKGVYEVEVRTTVYSATDLRTGSSSLALTVK